MSLKTNEIKIESFKNDLNEMHSKTLTLLQSISTLGDSLKHELTIRDKEFHDEITTLKN